MEAYRAKVAKWRKENKEYVIAYNAFRHAAKLKRTPSWLTDQQKQEMKAIYERAKNLTLVTGITHHVDHILPLQGKLVSGLHVPTNLQILTESENCSKQNFFVPE